MTFKGRKVGYNTNGYPWVWWPEHPVAMSTGMAYVHRVVAHDMTGRIPSGYHVHHVDGDRENWDWENLLVLTPSQHYDKHADKIILECDFCSEEIERTPSQLKKSGNAFCDQECFYRFSEVIDWPSLSELVEMVDQFGYSKAGRILGVSDNAVRKRINRRVAQLEER